MYFVNFRVQINHLLFYNVRNVNFLLHFLRKLSIILRLGCGSKQTFSMSDDEGRQCCISGIGDEQESLLTEGHLRGYVPTGAKDLGVRNC